MTNNDDISVDGSTLVIEDKFTKYYTEVEYIQSTGSQYINTNYKPNSTTVVELEASITQATSGQNYPKFYGTISDSNGQTYMLQADTTNRTLQTAFYNNSGYQVSSRINFTYGTKYKFTQNKNEFLIDNVSQGTSTFLEFSSTLNMFIFVINYNGSANAQYTYMKFYSMKIYDNNVLVRDFVPCYRKSDNVIGLYDKVNGDFYTNAGSGTFLKGADV